MAIVGSSLALLFLPRCLRSWLRYQAYFEGPGLFRQQRLGQFQVPFSFSQISIHACATDAESQGVRASFIAGRAEPNASQWPESAV